MKRRNYFFKNFKILLASCVFNQNINTFLHKLIIPIFMCINYQVHYLFFDTFIFSSLYIIRLKRFIIKII
ncbi:hypothetical protein UF16_21665 [Chromobacterium violaceum]|nr:hypothetical protein UF16_21665 [Chromobacterium violaceum]